MFCRKTDSPGPFWGFRRHQTRGCGSVSVSVLDTGRLQGLMSTGAKKNILKEISADGQRAGFSVWSALRGQSGCSVGGVRLPENLLSPVRRYRAAAGSQGSLSGPRVSHLVA